MRADNHGEGGILALLALVRSRGEAAAGARRCSSCSGSSARRCSTATASSPRRSRSSAPSRASRWPPRPSRRSWCRITVVILVGALLRSSATAPTGIGRVFGPIMLVWFVLHRRARRARHPAATPRCSAPSNPLVRRPVLRRRHGSHGFLVLGAVVLVITGGEALYADMGHFGRRPIRLAWFVAGAPGAAAQLLRPGGARSIQQPRRDQSVLRAGARLVALPDDRDRHRWPPSSPRRRSSRAPSRSPSRRCSSATARASRSSTPRSTEAGQIYVPEVNWALGVACVALVLGFRSSTNLAAAYGIAVTGTMIITTILFYRVARDLWRWTALRAGGLSCALPGGRPRLLRRQHDQVRRRRLVPARRGRRGLHPDDHLEARPGQAGRRWSSSPACRSTSSWRTSPSAPRSGFRARPSS